MNLFSGSAEASEGQEEEISKSGKHSEILSRLFVRENSWFNGGLPPSLTAVFFLKVVSLATPLYSPPLHY